MRRCAAAERLKPSDNAECALLLIRAAFQLALRHAGGGDHDSNSQHREKRDETMSDHKKHRREHEGGARKTDGAGQANQLCRVFGRNSKTTELTSIVDR